MFVYSLISWEEMRSWPIFLAWVSTRRYWLSRAATPTVSRSPTRPSLSVMSPAVVMLVTR